MRGRRHFVREAAMTMAAAQMGVLGTSEAQTGEPRELAALGRAKAWLNSPRLAAANLRGKVVLVDFCTYTCINWQRTLPFVRAWAQKYTGGLVVVGVHTPEFEFEHDVDNVRRAVQRMKIEHPIVIDNDYAIWRAFKNQYWPALYFIDARGVIRHQHFGEGQYEQSEMTIRRLLAEAGATGVPEGVVSVEAAGAEVAADWDDLKSPERYLGYDRTESFASPGSAARDQRHVYSAPSQLSLNQWAVVGEWTMTNQAMVLRRAGGRLVTRFHARDLHLVMGPQRPDVPVRCRVSIDGKPPGPAHGADVDEGGNGTVAEQRLYQLVRQPRPVVDRVFEIEFLGAGVEAYAFTFG